jgi:ubiquinone/menaquinone biosynthesis C-methylase UbiE
MRLNLGCGKHYKKGFINIDAFDATVADSLMSAEDLAFPSNAVDAIEACQLIEHLGYIHTVYALAEWFRVLKPGGTLLIETPDLESSMRHYLRGDHDIRRETLTWMYGVESPGMEHRLCFPKILLKHLVKKTGFTDLTTSSFIMEKHHPALRLSCKKPQDAAAFQIIAHCRKNMIQHHLIDFDSSVLALEQEKLLDFFLRKLQQYLRTDSEKIFKNIIIRGCLQSVPMTQVFLQECHRYKRVSHRTMKTYAELLQFLSSIHFTSLLLSVVKENPPRAGTQGKTMRVVTQFGRQTIKKILSESTEAEAVKKALVTLPRQHSRNETEFFSETILEYKAADLCYQAMKDFLGEDFISARAALQDAIRLNRNHLLYYWNLGRVLMLTKKHSEALLCYMDALTLVRLSNDPMKGKLERTLRKERATFSPQKHGKPILDVRQ